MEKKDTSLKVMIVILSILVLLLGGFIAYKEFYAKPADNCGVTNDISKEMTAGEKYAAYATNMKKVIANYKESYCGDYDIKDLSKCNNKLDSNVIVNVSDGMDYSSYVELRYNQEVYLKLDKGFIKLADKAIGIATDGTISQDGSKNLYIIYEDGTVASLSAYKMAEKDYSLTKHSSLKNIVSIIEVSEEENGNIYAVDIDGKTYKIN